ncbi:uncharacterized protein J3D65DRAFT_630668 [Phyllosticta citribraziliensis]|uniref:Uncharacterized protein n=1 Tax=Phyllosticta citribraziliensis TaxID=989973 RepID=A0ABR1LJ72_9PEZI
MAFCTLELHTFLSQADALTTSPFSLIPSNLYHTATTRSGASTGRMRPSRSTHPSHDLLMATPGTSTQPTEPPSLASKNTRRPGWPWLAGWLAGCLVGLSLAGGRTCAVWARLGSGSPSFSPSLSLSSGQAGGGAAAAAHRKTTAKANNDK